MAPWHGGTGAPLPVIAAVVAAALLMPARAAAQSLSAAATVFNAQHRISFAGTVSERTGVFIGAGGAARLGPVQIGLTSLMGSLADSEDPANSATSVRSTSLTVMVRAAPWVALGAEAEARVFDADGGVTSWLLLGATARLTPPMGGSGLAGLIEVTMFPAATSRPLGASISPALRGTAGVSFAFNGPFEARLGYRFERFDFAADAGGDARLEQFRGIVAGVGLRLGRR